MCHRKGLILWIIVFSVAVGFSPSAVKAEEGRVEGTFWCTDRDGNRVELPLVQGIAYPHELQGGDRVKALLMMEGADRERVLEVLAKGEMMFAARLEGWVTFDLCRFEDPFSMEVCGVHFSCADNSSSKSGFGVYDHFTPMLQFVTDYVSADLKTTEPEDADTDRPYGFDVSFALTVTRFDSE